MILVFGGTTEGRQAAEVLEEAGSAYYYSTKTGEQDITLHHGQRIDGALDAGAMLAFCKAHSIRLIVDAAHPFASQLHQAIAHVSEALGIPAVRYERIFPPRDKGITWIDDYCQIPRDIHSLLATTGVQSIAKLKLLESEGIGIYYRILNRESSIALAQKQGAALEQLCYYNDPKDIPIKTDAILLKESGISGGIHCQLSIVNGPYGLRRAIEKLLPEFYPLHSGLTTGTCATAAAVAETLRMTKGEMPHEVPVVLPNGETISVAVTYGKGYASVFKEAGDDPDVININKAPREMLRNNIRENVRITISVPQGAEIARRTFNPRLGIEGGISIIGVSGIVKPFSEEAFIKSIRKCMTVAKASGSKRVVINSGGKSERFVKALYPDLPQQAFVEYGNYIGETLKIANELEIEHVTLGVMLGKAVKLAAGHLDTHSRKAVTDKTFIEQLLHESAISTDISDMTLARELWERIPENQLAAFAHTVIRHCAAYCNPVLPNGNLTILLIDDNGKIYEV